MKNAALKATLFAVLVVASSAFAQEQKKPKEQQQKTQKQGSYERGYSDGYRDGFRAAEEANSKPSNVNAFCNPLTHPQLGTWYHLLLTANGEVSNVGEFNGLGGPMNKAHCEHAISALQNTGWKYFCENEPAEGGGSFFNLIGLSFYKGTFHTRVLGNFRYQGTDANFRNCVKLLNDVAASSADAHDEAEKQR